MENIVPYGTEGDVDLQNELEGEVFEPLMNLEYFKSFSIHPEPHTIVWPNRVYFAPKFLRADSDSRLDASTSVVCR